MYGVTAGHRAYFSFRVSIIALIVLLIPVFSLCMEFSPLPLYKPEPKRDKYLFEASVGYLWGTNQLRYRDADKPFMPPGRRDLTMDSPIFGIQAGAFLLPDLAIRGQFRINLPQTWGNRFFFVGENESTIQELPWIVKTRYIESDISAIYHFGLGDMPYTAAMVGGYRFYKTDFDSHRPQRWSDSFTDHFQIHVPYLGAYYSHSNLAGALVRFEFLVSPVILCKMKANQIIAGRSTQLDGVSYLGQWMDTTFELSKKIGGGAFVGGLLRYNFINPIARAKAEGFLLPTDGKTKLHPTDYVMDMRHHLFIGGLTFTYTF